MSSLTLSFHGGAREVTGACYLLEADDKKILIDCGLMQGGRFAEHKNREPFGFDPALIDALIITHAHLDHVGRIPKLIKEGFRGAIYSTPPTKDLAALILEDGAGLLGREAEAHRESPLYIQADVDAAMRQWQTVDYYIPLSFGGIKARLLEAGHILGSAMVEIKTAEKTILFSGDLGADQSLLLPPIDVAPPADYLVIESAYGDRSHPTIAEARFELERAIEDVAARRGTLMIPSFATERTQDILFLLNEMAVLKQIPEMPIFVDSPLAIKVTEVFERYSEYYRDEIKNLFRAHPNLFKSKMLKNTPSVDESKAINDVPPPKVIVAGSGMMTGGRILHHLRRYLPDERSTLLIVGYQVAGSLGRRILDGVKEVKLFGESIPVRAKVLQAHGFSAHADEKQLFNFVASLKDSLGRVFVVQGETPAASALVQNIRDRLGLPADAPEMHQKFEL